MSDIPLARLGRGTVIGLPIRDGGPRYRYAGRDAWKSAYWVHDAVERVDYGFSTAREARDWVDSHNAESGS